MNTRTSMGSSVSMMINREREKRKGRSVVQQNNKLSFFPPSFLATPKKWN